MAPSLVVQRRFQEEETLQEEHIDLTRLSDELGLGSLLSQVHVTHWRLLVDILIVHGHVRQKLARVATCMARPTKRNNRAAIVVAEANVSN